MLVFHDRHQSSLVSAEHIARLLGHTTAEVVTALESFETSGLAERSRVSEGVRLYEVIASADPPRRDALQRLMTLADGHIVRRLLARRLRGSDPPDQNKNDFPLRGVKGTET